MKTAPATQALLPLLEELLLELEEDELDELLLDEELLDEEELEEPPQAAATTGLSAGKLTIM